MQLPNSEFESRSLHLPGQMNLPENYLVDLCTVRPFPEFSIMAISTHFARNWNELVLDRTQGT
jgi:hypothetical protein